MNWPRSTSSVGVREQCELNEQQIATLEALGPQRSLWLELRRTADARMHANKQLENSSLKDELTGLYNRRGIFPHAERGYDRKRGKAAGRGVV